MTASRRRASKHRADSRPSEMLGVSAGLDYLILDARGRLAYSELTAVMPVIGVPRFLPDLGGICSCTLRQASEEQ
ncbi:hypothetical protein HDG40_002057 [Paraburkholderia sp. JPY158]|uniref:Uncharacterized protein n=1 Tax=Paraburkholderia atlantica TaxID=2654982 RepID=A0A7W8Q525_PARAM|nr:hypothetical protein [Paraburkholderia atlantica]MBB5423913.1 hypothetical protein [Paraburkholderia atlantica]